MPKILNSNRPRFVFVNNTKLYQNFRRRKKIATLRQHETVLMPNLRQALASQRIKTVEHIWTTGDRYYKLSLKYYNDSSLWWIIAAYNHKPTEGHIRKGDVLMIPTPIELVLYNI
jgi:nucleoid-associated protein YgaU